ncbi:ParB-like nuclease domain-containing protein, partial [Enterococcus faecalis]|nr:ParB-like nuclease domain-containing protein [Enterococcus faecalis]
PVLNVKLVPLTKIIANDYNPNKVAPPEMDLLELSIIEDGYTQPLVCYYDGNFDRYILIDGFHRYRVAKERLSLSEVPVTVINRSLENRIASTIRHNRARGTHEVGKMEVVVKNLVDKGWNDTKIAKKLGMDMEEVFRFKQSSGLKEAFSNHEFSKSWISFENRYYKSDKLGREGS